MITANHRGTLAAFACTFALLSPILVGSQATAAPLVVIDAGHGGPYSNANANGLREKRVNLSIALELRRQLIARGYRVSMTRTTDRAVTRADIPTWNWRSRFNRWDFRADGRGGIQSLPKDDLQARAAKANRLGADVFISIHNNGSTNRSARGTETFASRRDPLGRSLSILVHNQIVRRTGLRDRKAQTADFYVCRWTNMPAILVEGAFITNSSDARKLKKSWFRRRIAVGIAEGVDTWFSRKPFRPTARPVSTKYVSHAAVAASRLQFPQGSRTIVVAKAADWADASMAPMLAVGYGAPLLWTGESGPNSGTTAEIARLAPERIVLVGIEGSLDTSAVASSLSAAASLETSSVQILTGQNRAALAASIATASGPESPRQVMLIDEADTDSMLAAAPVSATLRIPVLLTRGNVLPAETSAYLSRIDTGLCTAILMGRSASLPAAITARFASVKRTAAADITARAGWLNGLYFRTTSLKPVVASCANGPEYLTAAAYAARAKRPVIPVRGRVLPDQSRLWITNRRSSIKGFEVFDARKTIPASMEHILRKADYE